MAAPAPGRIAFVDFGRGFAILSVVVFHFADFSVVGPASRAFAFGAAGVHLFLLLAGFGLMLSRFSASPGEFYRRRFAKILVPYYLFVTLALLVNFIHPYYPGAGCYAYFGHLFWYKMLDASIIGSFGGQLWFVSTIVALYLVFPVLAWLLARFGAVRFVVAACVVSLVYWVTISVLGVAGNHAVQRFFLQYLWEFCLGMALGQAYKRAGYLVWEQPAWVLLAAVVLGFGGAVLVVRSVPHVAQIFDDVPSLVGFTAAAALLERGAKRWIPALHAAMLFLGTISFELFLVHMLVKAALRPILPSHAGPLVAWLWVVAAIGVSIAAAIAFQQVAKPVVGAVERALAPMGVGA